MKQFYSTILLLLTVKVVLTQQYQLILSSLPNGGSGFKTSPSLTYFAFRDTNEYNIYHQSNNTYTYLFTLGRHYTSSATTGSCLVLDSPPRLFCPSMTVSGGNQLSAIKIVNISSTVNGSTPPADVLLLTSTPVGASTTTVAMKGSSNVLMAVTFTTSHVFRWDSGLGQYTLAFNNAFTNAGSKLFDITEDGGFFVKQIGPANSILRLYKYSAGTYTQTDQYDFGAALTTLSKITMTGSSGGGSVILALRDTGVTYRFTFSSAGVLTLALQTPMPFPSAGSWIGLSRGGNYLLQPSTAPPTIRLYKYDPAIFNYLLTFENKSLVYPPAAGYLQIAEDGSYFYFSLENTAATSLSNAFSYLYFYYQCTISYCSHCSGIGFCDICNPGFILNGAGCTCPSGTILVGSSCADCSVSFCSSCSAVSVCTSCSDGYEIQGGSCDCGINRTVSLNSSRCVQCLITDCLRCDVDNLCSEYKPSDLLSSAIKSSSDLNKQVEDLRNNQYIILGFICGLFICMVIILAVIVIKMKAPISPQNADAIATAEVNQRENLKELSETNLKASVSKSNIQQNPSMSMNEILFQEKELMTRPKKRRAKKGSTVNEQIQNVEVIIVNPVISDDCT